MIFLLHQEVSLYLSPLRRQKSSTPLAVFTIPALSTTWNRLAVQVRHLSQPYQPPNWTWIATFLPWHPEKSLLSFRSKEGRFASSSTANRLTLRASAGTRWFMLFVFLTSRRRMFKFNFQKVEFDPASSLYIGQVSLWDQIERGWSFFLQR